MKKLAILFITLFLFNNFAFAKSKQTNSVKHHKSGSYTVTTGNISNTYDKKGHKKSSKVKDSSGNTTTKNMIKTEM